MTVEKKSVFCTAPLTISIIVEKEIIWKRFLHLFSDIKPFG